MRILLVEDEKNMASFIKRGLEEERYVVDVAPNGEKALFLAETNPYDLIILDVMLPDTTGFSICKDLRSKKIDTFILMLTARDDVQDKVLGLKTGADDYLSKPFDFDELLARIGALLRRKRLDKNPVLKVGDLELNQLTHKVTRAKKEITLTSKEYSLLEYLMLHAGQVVTRTAISEHVWNEDFDSFTNVIDVFINRLRNKVDRDFKKSLFILCAVPDIYLRNRNEKSFRRKIVIGFLAMVFLSVFTTGLAFFTTRNMQNVFLNTMRHNVASLKAAEELELALISQKGFLSNYFFRQGPCLVGEAGREESEFL